MITWSDQPEWEWWLISSTILENHYSCDGEVCCTDYSKRNSLTCICLPFSGASLVGRAEYMWEDSPSFLGSRGLFGRSGKPDGEKTRSIVIFNSIKTSLVCNWFQNNMCTRLCRRWALVAWFCVSCHRTLSQSHRGLRCTAPMRCQGAGPLAEDMASPNSSGGQKNWWS